MTNHGICHFDIKSDRNLPLLATDYWSGWATSFLNWLLDPWGSSMIVILMQWGSNHKQTWLALSLHRQSFLRFVSVRQIIKNCVANRSSTDKISKVQRINISTLTTNTVKNKNFFTCMNFHIYIFKRLFLWFLLMLHLFLLHGIIFPNNFRLIFLTTLSV